MQLEDNAVAFVRFNLRFPLTNLTSKLYKERTLLPTKLYIFIDFKASH